MDDGNLTVEEILSEAIDRPADQRRSFVETACADNPERLRETLSLLNSFEAADDFMEQPATLGVIRQEGQEEENDWVGRTIGGYELIQLIGTGGAGRVYLAHRADRDFTQQVAVKIIRRAAMGKEMLRRFRNECRVLAMLEHPNIARMIDGGTTEEGTPFIVMEYVDGVSIDRYCQENQISLKQQLQLFLDVCGAVQLVHQHSTIHRDIKPGNILVTDEGQAKLVDFGISRILDLSDDMELTIPGLELMTPMYASPEQLRGDLLATGTDIYSLGAVLYRVLSGTPPFKEDTQVALKEAVINRNPSKPSQTVLDNSTPESDRSARRLARDLKGDLDTIVLKALRKEPERRYASVDQFADDIRRYLAGQPVSAQPDKLKYRARKFVSRNTAAVTVAFLLLVVMIGATIVSLALFNRAEIARVEAVKERQIASRERNAAVTTSEFLQDLLASVNPAVIDGRLDITVREILDEASERLEKDQIQVPEVAAALHFVIGRSYMNLAEYEASERHLGRSAELRRNLSPPDSEGIMRSVLALCQIHEKQGFYAAAESLLITVLPADTANENPSIISELEASLARIYANLSRLEDAEKFARRSIASADLISEPADPMHAQSRSELGNSLYRLGRYPEAEPIYREAVATAIRTIGDQHIVTGECYNNHALALGALGRNEEAIEQLLKTLAIYEDALPPEHPEFANTHLNLGDQYSLTEKYPEALATYSLARDELVAIHGPDHIMVSLAINGIGFCHWKTNNLEEAKIYLAEAIAAMDKALGSTHPWVATPRNNLGLVYYDLGQSDDAKRMANEALEIMRANLPEKHPHLARPLGLLAQLEMDAGNYQAALVMAREATEICTEAHEEGQTDRVTAEKRLAECLAKTES